MAQIGHTISPKDVSSRVVIVQVSGVAIAHEISLLNLVGESFRKES